jgi:hypothetical protein
VRNDDEPGFLGFDEGDDVVEAVFEEEGFLGVLLTTTMSEIKSVIERDDETREVNERTLAPLSFSAAGVKRAFFSYFDSGRYLFNNLNSCVAVLSRVCQN